MIDLPVGFRFKPSKIQLVDYFLKTKLSGQPLPPCYSGLFLEVDLYDGHPQNIFALARELRGDVNGGDDGLEEGYYCFCRRRKRGTRFIRCVEGQGTWSEKSTTKKVYDKTMSSVVGFFKYLKFMPKLKGRYEYEWMMHEYFLGKRDETVLCYIVAKKRDLSDVGDLQEASTSSKRDRGTEESTMTEEALMPEEKEKEILDKISFDVQEDTTYNDQQLVQAQEPYAGESVPKMYGYNSYGSNGIAQVPPQQYIFNGTSMRVPQHGCLLYGNTQNLQQNCLVDGTIQIPQQECLFDGTKQVLQQNHQNYEDEAALYAANNGIHQVDTASFDRSTTGYYFPDDIDP